MLLILTRGGVDWLWRQTYVILCIVAGHPKRGGVLVGTSKIRGGVTLSGGDSWISR